MISIVLAEDHHVVRQGIRALLEAEADFFIEGECADGLEAAEIVERLQPDVLILDVMMPGLNGLDVIQLVRQRSPDTRMVVLSMYDSEVYVLQALRNGADGYVLKDSSAEHLVQAVREVMRGQRYLSSPLTERAIEAYITKGDDEPLDVYETLTAREREVLHLVAEGYTNAQIANRLSISPRTAETHRTNMMRKLDLNTQTDLIRYALKRGIISMDDD